MADAKQQITIDLLNDLYHQKLMTLNEMSRHLGVPRRKMDAIMNDLGLKRRKTGPRSPKHHGSWTGGRRRDRSGYIYVYCPDHPNATCGGYVREHRLVMERHIGRMLLRSEVVHHKNDDTSDNRIENLRLFDKNADHLAETLNGKCPKWTEKGFCNMRESKMLKHIPPATELALMHETMTLKELAKKYSCSRNTLSKRLADAGFQAWTNARKANRNWPPKEELEGMLLTYSVPQIAKILGKVPGSLYARLESLGIPAENYVGKKQERHDSSMLL